MDQDVETKVEDMVAVVEYIMAAMKEKILAVVTMVVVGTMILEIIMDNSSQIIDQQRGAFSMVVLMDLNVVVEVMDMVVEGSKNLA